MGDLIKSPNFLNLTSLSMFEIILTNMSILLSFLFFSCESNFVRDIFIREGLFFQEKK